MGYVLSAQSERGILILNNLIHFIKYMKNFNVNLYDFKEAETERTIDEAEVIYTLFLHGFYLLFHVNHINGSIV